MDGTRRIEGIVSCDRGVVALGRPHDGQVADLVGARHAEMLPVPESPWAMTGRLFAGTVTDDASHAAALDGALRGADVIVDVAQDRLPAFIEDLERVGLALWHPASARPAHADWVPLLDALASGATTEEAARRCHLSVRSAHRRLAEARAVLGVSSTAAAVARWSSSSFPP